MNTQTHSISSWAELAKVLVQACEWSDPSTAEPIGNVTFERLMGNIVHMSISVDLVPMAIIHDKDTML